MICGINFTKLQIKHIQQHSKHWMTQTHTTAAGYGKCIRNELTTKQLGKFKLVYPPRLWSCPLAVALPHWGVPSCTILSLFLMPTPFLRDFPLATWWCHGTERWAVHEWPEETCYLYTQLSSQTVEVCWYQVKLQLLWCKTSPQVVGSAWQMVCELVEAVVVGELGACGWAAYSDRMRGIYSGVLIWWETCCLTCTGDNRGRVCVAV